jgi:hypothetical protein
MRTILFASFFALGLAACGGGADQGETCNETDDLTCDEGLDCIPLAMGCIHDCEGTCEKPCSSDADCGSHQFCAATRGAQFCEEVDFSPN